MGKVQISYILKEVVHIITLCFKGLIFQKLKISQKLLLLIQTDWLPYVVIITFGRSTIGLPLVCTWFCPSCGVTKVINSFLINWVSHPKPDRDWLFLLDPPFYLRIKEQFLTHLFCLTHQAMDRVEKFILNVIYCHQNCLQVNQNIHFLVRFCLPS